MFRRLLTVATFLSLSLAGLAVVLMVISAGHGYDIEFDWNGQRWRAASDHGRIGVDDRPEGRARQKRFDAANDEYAANCRAIEARRDDLFAQWQSAAPADRGGIWDEYVRLRDERTRLTDTYYANRPPSYVPERRYAVPHLLLVLAGLLVPAARLVASIAADHRRLRRHPVGVCQACGYDLRATPDRCPECGAVRVRRRKVKADVGTPPA